MWWAGGKLALLPLGKGLAVLRKMPGGVWKVRPQAGFKEDAKWGRGADLAPQLEVPGRK